MFLGLYTKHMTPKSKRKCNNINYTTKATYVFVTIVANFIYMSSQIT